MLHSRKVSLKKVVGIDPQKKGLSYEEVVRQRLSFGTNVILEKKRHPLFELLLATLRDPMIGFLAGLAVLFWFLGDQSEAITLWVAMVPLLAMDFFLHFRTEASLKPLKSKLGSQSRVIRNGVEQEIDSAELVPGDRVYLSSGQFIPADGILLSSVGLQTDESTLTGESLPISKKTETPFDLLRACQSVEAAVPQERLLYAGTRVLSGGGQLLLLETGRGTVYGQLLESLEKTPLEMTPLQREIALLVSKLVWVALFLCLVLAGVRLYQGQGWVDALLSAATLAVAAIPEEFPVVFSFFLGVGAYRLAKSHVLVRRAVSVENIGRIHRICTDKTGTLTTGQVTLSHLVPVRDGGEVDLLLAARAASQVSAEDLIDQAIFAYPVEGLDVTWSELHRFPYTEERKCEVGVGRYHLGPALYWLKGAPSVVFGRCSFQPEQRQFWEEKVLAFAQQGHKILACANRQVSETEADLQVEPVTGFQFVGLLAFEDPLRSGVVAAISECHSMGIRVTVLTGDHLGTACSISEEMGLSIAAKERISGEEEPEKLQEDWMRAHPEVIRDWKVIARCTPLQKQAVVRIFQECGEHVLVTGDGVNDVPALKLADIGIAMGIRGSQSAKESASMILMDDHFASIVGAIHEGRALFQSLRRAFLYLILMHVPLVLSASLIPLLGYPILYQPVHIIYLELIIHPTALFAFQSLEADRKKGDSSWGGILQHAHVLQLLGVGLVVSGVLLAMVLLGEESSFLATRSRVLSCLSVWSSLLVIHYSRCRTLLAKGISLATSLSGFLVTQFLSQWQALGLVPLPVHEWVLMFTVLLITGWVSVRRRAPCI